MATNRTYNRVQTVHVEMEFAMLFIVCMAVKDRKRLLSGAAARPATWNHLDKISQEFEEWLTHSSMGGIEVYHGYGDPVTTDVRTAFAVRLNPEKGLGQVEFKVDEKGNPPPTIMLAAAVAGFNILSPMNKISEEGTRLMRQLIRVAKSGEAVAIEDCDSHVTTFGTVVLEGGMFYLVRGDDGGYKHLINLEGTNVVRISEFPSGIPELGILPS